MTSFADLVDARWRLLTEPDDSAGRLRYAATPKRFEHAHGHMGSGRAKRLAVADLFKGSRHVMAALEAS
jgi:hypothetical protein